MSAGADFDSDEEPELRTDEYGERFEDYGFLKRADEHKQAGNADFKKDRFEKALKEYECALDQLLTVAHDKSIIIGKQKWNDVIVLRSTIHLNKSACQFKLKNWQGAADAALECLMGNIHEEMMFTDPAIRAKVKQSQQKHGNSDSPFLEQKLPKATRAKAWFRLSKSHANLGHLDRAKEALAKAKENQEDRQGLTEMNEHALRIEALDKQQKQRQKQQFKGFFEKLQERGGYVDTKTVAKAHWDTLDYAQKLKQVEELDDSDGDDACLPISDPVVPGASVEAGLSFEQCLEQRSDPVKAPARGVDPAESVIKDKSENQASTANTLYTAADISALRQKDAQRREREWRQRSKEQEIDDLEEDELRQARERLARKKAGGKMNITDSDAE